MRSADAHALLADHDTALPGLPAVLDGALLGERLAAPVHRSYLRYKPGTSATALVDVDGRPAIAQAWTPEAGAKRAKALKYARPEDVILDIPEEGLLVLDALADRRLPALRLLVRSGRVGPWLSGAGHPTATDSTPKTLSHKPARRWVGLLPLAGTGQSAVLRAYTSSGYDSALAAHGLIDPDRCPSIRLPRVLATHRRGLLALEHLPGCVLDESAPEAALHCLGASLGELHAHLYGDERVSTGTLKSEVSHLRAALGGRLASRPYRLDLPVTTDVDAVRRAVRRGDPRTAVSAYGGDLVPGTSSPFLTELAEYLAVAVRECLLLDPDPQAVLAYAEVVPDAEVVQRALDALGDGAHPARAELTARLAAALR